jgi:sugar/nucleoside kinase (ribokinase family)
MKYHVVGIGNPLLDLTLQIDNELLKELGLKKGSMHLVELAEAENILKKINQHEIKKTPGGSVANVLAGVSSMGGKTVLLGKIGLDEHGQTYHDETSRAGVEPRLTRHDSEKTGHAIAFITPDGERTFVVHLGAALHFELEDIHDDSIKNSHFLHLEGFKLEDCRLKNTINHAVKVAKDNKTKISVDLSDSELVKRNLDYLKHFVKENVDIVFANEDEAKAFTGVNETEALDEIYKMCDIAIVKLGERGSLIKASNCIHKIPPYKTIVKNLNGAGDMYAAGILYGLANNMPLEKSGNIASYIASLVVATEGARADINLKHVFDNASDFTKYIKKVNVK